MIDVGPIQQEYSGNGAPVLVLAVCRDGDFFLIDKLRGDVLRSLAVVFSLLRAVRRCRGDGYGQSGDRSGV